MVTLLLVGITVLDDKINQIKYRLKLDCLLKSGKWPPVAWADYVSIDSGALEYYDKSTNQDVTFVSK